MFGRFLELAIATRDIAASVQFYQRLGFQQLITGDAWSHRYGVLSDGRIQLGLHECAMPSPAVSFVLPGLARAQQRLRAVGIEPELVQFGPDGLHYLRLRDPGEHPVMLLEARTFSPAPPGSSAESLCGYFLHLSLPQPDFQAARLFWERAGLIALPEERDPFPHVPLTSDQLDLAFHRRRSFEAPLLVFACADTGAVSAQLQQLGVPLSDERLSGLSAAHSALIEAPEGTVLLLQTLE